MAGSETLTSGVISAKRALDENWFHGIVIFRGCPKHGRIVLEMYLVVPLIVRRVVVFFFSTEELLLIVRGTNAVM